MTKQKTPHYDSTKSLSENIEMARTKRRLKAVLARKVKPARVQIKDDISPAEAHRRDLIDAAEQAIAAQKRIIEHDGPLEAHMLSLLSLEQSLESLKASNSSSTTCP